ncbi:hypothetical protein VTO42DRAFT_6561 [Malbranchea cinnamomea]
MYSTRRAITCEAPAAWAPQQNLTVSAVQNASRLFFSESERDRTCWWGPGHPKPRRARAENRRFCSTCRIRQGCRRCSSKMTLADSRLKITLNLRDLDILVAQYSWAIFVDPFGSPKTCVVVTQQRLALSAISLPGYFLLDQLRLSRRILGMNEGQSRSKPFRFLWYDLHAMRGASRKLSAFQSSWIHHGSR